MSSSAARALRVLDEIARSDRPLGVTEIARILSLPPGTVFRSLDALLRAGLIARYRASTRYVTGPSAEQLRRSAIARFPIREVCLPYLRQLASISGETVSLHVRVGLNEVRICSVPGTGEIMTPPPAGEMQALADSCAGQAMLAFMAVDGTVGRGPPRLRASLGAIAARGFALARGAQPAIAFPIRVNESAIAAVTIEGVGANPERPLFPECLEVIAKAEALAAAQPALFANPFAHLQDWG
jgi:DNA-binding IclR family transcriptional regulator